MSTENTKQPDCTKQASEHSQREQEVRPKFGVFNFAFIKPNILLPKMVFVEAEELKKLQEKLELQGVVIENLEKKIVGLRQAVENRDSEIYSQVLTIYNLSQKNTKLKSETRKYRDLLSSPAVADAMAMLQPSDDASLEAERTALRNFIGDIVGTAIHSFLGTITKSFPRAANYGVSVITTVKNG